MAIVLLLAAAAAAKDKKLPEAARPGDVKPGQEALLKSAKGVYYFLRVPKKYDEKKGARLVVFLHGSNMNGLSYLRSFEAKRWANDAITVLRPASRFNRSSVVDGRLYLTVPESGLNVLDGDTFRPLPDTAQLGREVFPVILRTFAASARIS